MRILKSINARPTLREQLDGYKLKEELRQLSNDELISLLLPYTLWQHIDFWTFRYIPLLHRLFWWSICFIRPYVVEERRRYWR